MYTAFGWGGCAPSHHGNQRACDLISGQTSAGHLSHQCSQASGRPILHLVSSSRRPRREADYVNSGSSSSAERSLGGCRKDPPRLEVAPMGEDAPGDASQLVGECDRQHVVMQAPSGGHGTTSAATRLPHVHPGRRRGRSSCRYRCRSRRSHSSGSQTCVLHIWYLLPAYVLTEAGARPDHPISGQSSTS